jgi:5-formyltetrahydrofolate cyclo-ligase
LFLKWNKSELRKRALKARALANKQPLDCGHALITHFPDEIWPAINSVVAGYSPIGSEIDPRPLMELFHCEQVRLGLPVMQGGREPLEFRQWRPDDALITGSFGVDEPAETSAVLQPSLVLAPLVAADKQGGRLGYGKGYYDRTICKLRAAGPVLIVGLAYADQIFDRVPTGRHDQRLDWIVTELGAFKIQAQ